MDRYLRDLHLELLDGLLNSEITCYQYRAKMEIVYRSDADYNARNNDDAVMEAWYLGDLLAFDPIDERIPPESIPDWLWRKGHEIADVLRSDAEYSNPDVHYGAEHYAASVCPQPPCFNVWDVGLVEAVMFAPLHRSLPDLFSLIRRRIHSRGSDACDLPPF